MKGNLQLIYMYTKISTTLWKVEEVIALMIVELRM